jgi:hypothetical protein
MKRTKKLLKVLWNYTYGSVAALLRWSSKTFVRSYYEDVLDHQNITITTR